MPRLPVVATALATAVAATLLAAAIPAAARAQDPFEIQVYEYATVPHGQWNLETHVNYTGHGTTRFEGAVAPTQGQSHLTFELTRGITDYFEMAGYLVLARRAGEGPEYAGYRLRPRVRAPESWGWPVGVSLSAEVGFPRATFEENGTTLEIRPVIEKQLGRWQLDVNPVVGRALRGPGKSEGWDFEPGVRVAHQTFKRAELSVEYYASTGSVTDPLPVDEQVHQVFPGVDFSLGERAVLNLGYGFRLTDAGNGDVLKMRLGVLFGGK
jgi:hypothetical protein